VAQEFRVFWGIFKGNVCRQQDHAGHVHDNEETSTSEEEYHFSYYAFDGRSGASRWKHEPGDFESHGTHDESHEVGF
jgi:hypothetical protein